MHNRPYFADSQAFLALHGQPPAFDPQKPPQLDLALVTSVRPTNRDFDAAFAEHCAFRKSALLNPDTHLVRKASDLSRVGTGLIFGMQNAPDGLTVDRVHQLRNAGIRVMALAYDETNAYGSGYRGDGGLTNRGKHLLEWMWTFGIIPDLSHLNEETALGVLDFLDEAGLGICPMASHSGCASVYPHPRNLSDEVVRKIRGMEGYIGIPAITFLLTQKLERDGDYLDASIRHMTWVTKLCRSSEHTGIGSGGIHQDMTMQQAREHFERLTGMLDTQGALGEYFPDRPPALIQDGSCMFDIIRQKLIDNGFSLKMTEGFCGRNFREFLKRSLPRS